MTIPNQEIHLKVLRHLEGHPDVTQRELAQHLGVSLGKVNYCLKALIDRGWIKASNFKNSNSKAAYAYLLTPHGMERKAQITLRFFKKKMEEYEQLKQELTELEQEVAHQQENQVTD
jgi:EPS-associated MarR family transcriptional regulator